MKNLAVILVALLAHQTLMAAQETVTCGAFPVSLNDFDFANHEFRTSFYLWCNSPSPTLKIDKTLEVVNALEYEPKFAEHTLKDGKYLTTMRYFAKVYHEWDMTNFPFDRQTLKIYLEDGVNDIATLRFVTDTKSSRAAEDLILNGWKLDGFKFTEEPYSYASGFGTQDDKSAFSRMTLTFDIKRQGWRNFLNYFIGFFVAVLLCVFSCLIKEERFSFIMGAIFALIGNKYVLDQMLPATGRFSLSDHLQLASFVFVLSISFLITIDSRLDTKTEARFRPIILRVMTVGLIAYVLYVGANAAIAFNS